MNEEAVLKLMVELGVINAGQLDELREKLEGLKTATQEQSEASKDSLDSMEYVPESLKNITEKTEELTTSSDHSAAAHRALHQALHKLNEVSPGLGTSLAMLANGLDAAKISAEGLGPAMEELITTMGPIVILMLSIQAATEYWDLYKEKVNEVAAEQAKAMKEIEESTKKAFEAQQALFDVMHPKDDAVKDLEEQLKNKEQTIKGDLEKQKAILEARKKIELAAAKNPEEKAAIEEKYKNAVQQAENFAEHEKNAAKASSSHQALSLVDENKKASQSHKDAASEAMKDLAKKERLLDELNAAPAGERNEPAIKKLNSEIKPLREKIKTEDSKAAEIDNASTDLYKYSQKTGGEADFAARGQLFKEQAQGIEHQGQKVSDISSFKPSGEKEDLAQLLRTLLEHNKLKDSQVGQIMGHLTAHQEDTVREYAFLKQRVESLQLTSGK